ncbi:MAG: hypothetical protein DSZ30_03550 [Aquificaceae bacterium]|nr:MAG: hypothetical protein DSZ30_03550 [Aquificaceae bacterium]
MLVKGLPKLPVEKMNEVHSKELEVLSELPRIKDARLRVGLHPLRSALPPRRVHAAPTPAYLPEGR